MISRGRPGTDGGDWRRRDTDRHENVTVDIGAPANPPGFDEELSGLQAGEQKTFDVRYPADYAIGELAGTTVAYDVNVKAIRTRVLPALDDEFAKDLGDVRFARRAAGAGARRPRARGAARGRPRAAMPICCASSPAG